MASGHLAQPTALQQEQEQEDHRGPGRGNLRRVASLHLDPHLAVAKRRDARDQKWRAPPRGAPRTNACQVVIMALQRATPSKKVCASYLFTSLLTHRLPPSS